MDLQRAARITLALVFLSAPALAQQASLSRFAPLDNTPTKEQCTDPQRAALIAFLLAFISTPALAQEGPQVVRDLAPLTTKKLTKEDLQQLMPGAKMSRLSASGNSHIWTNDPDGTFIVSSDNRNLPTGGSVMGTRSSTAPGKWHISDDGRYCVLIEWKSVPTEEWCRYFFVVSDGSYYATKSDRTPTEKVYKFQVSK